MTTTAAPPTLDLRPRPCPLCGSTDESRVLAESNIDPAKLDAFAFASRKLPEYMHHRLVECPRCDLLYATPLPSEDQLHVAYHQAAYDSQAEAACAARTYAALVDTLAPRLPDRAGALDIGTGDGAFLAELLDRGFTNVAGVEPSAAPIAAARPDIRPLIHHDIFRPGAFPPHAFSLVTCFQTMEHLHDPLAMCRSAHALLKPGGALLLVGHNRRAVSARLLGRRSPIFDVEHLQLFSPRSARELVRAAGFRGVQTRVLFNRYPLHYWLKLFPFPAGAKRRLIAHARTAAWGRLPLMVPAGNLATIAFRA